MVKISLFAAHVAGGDDAEEGASKGEDNGESTIFIGAAKSRVPSFDFGVNVVMEDNQRFVKKELLAFSDADPVFLYVF